MRTKKVTKMENKELIYEHISDAACLITELFDNEGLLEKDENELIDIACALFKIAEKYEQM